MVTPETTPGERKVIRWFFGAFFVPLNALIYGPILGVSVSFAGSVVPAMSAKDVKVAAAATVENSYTGTGFNETWNDPHRRGSYVGTFATK